MPTIGEGTAFRDAPRPQCRIAAGRAVAEAGACAVAGVATGVGAADPCQLARHADARAVALDLDLAEAGFVQQRRQIADQLVIDDPFFASLSVIAPLPPPAVPTSVFIASSARM